MNTKAFRGMTILIALILSLGAYIPARATSEAALTPAQTINIAYFYKPPNMDAASAAKNFSTMVLTNGDHTYRDQLKANGFSSTIPEYFRSEAIQDPGSCTATPLNNQAAYKPGDFCSISKNHPDWFLLDSSGRRITVTSGGNYYRMDPANAGWREFFVTRVMESQNQYGWTALFLDNVEASLGKFFGNNPAKYPDEASYQSAVAGFLQYLDVNYSQKYGRPFFGNIVALGSTDVWFNYLQYLDGALTERFAVNWDESAYLSADKWAADMAWIEKTQAQGKYAILVSPGYQTDLNRQNFAFASYLLVSNGKAAFRYAKFSAYREAWLYENYKVNLGSPLGGRYATGNLWRRDFSNGYVIVDPVNHTATIQRTVTPVGAGKYDDGHGNWSYNGIWQNYSGSGPYNNTLHYTSTVGSTSSFVFSGTQFILSYTQYPNRGSFEVSVDGSKIATINANGTTQWQKTFSSPVYSSGTHTVQLKNIGGSGTVMDADAIQILNGTSPVSAAGAGKYDGSDAHWSYNGAWQNYSGSGPYNSTLRYTTTVGNTASFTFSGTQFVFSYTQYPNRGSFDVSVDGSKVTTVNANGTVQWQKTYTSPVYASGTHTVQFKNIGGGGTVIDVDAIQILNGTTAVSAPGAGKYDNNDANWMYTGAWLNYSGTGPYNSTLKYTATVGDAASFTFSGTQFIFSYTQYPNRGSFEVYVDASKVATINANGTVQWQKTYTSPTFTAGTHVLQLKNIGGSGTIIDVDAIQVQ